MGSAIAYYLSQTDLRVLGIDRFNPPHEFGSSHGQTRIIRTAYFEHPDYVPLLKKAYENWLALEECSGEKILTESGGIMIGEPNSVLVTGAIKSAESYQLPYKILSSSELMAQFPCYKIPSHFIGVHEPLAGVLYPEKAIANYLNLASKNQVEFKLNTPVLNWKKSGSGYVVKTALEEFYCEKIVLASGSWIGKLLPELSLELSVVRRVLYWLDIKGSKMDYQAESFPIFIMEYLKEKFFYGFPYDSDGFKVAIHKYWGDEVDPDSINRHVSETEIHEITDLVSTYFKRVDQVIKSSVCMYTNTPDTHFIIDTHPAHSGVKIISACSGHGFKFASYIGEMIAREICGMTSKLNLDLFKIGRFLK